MGPGLRRAGEVSGDGGQPPGNKQWPAVTTRGCNPSLCRSSARTRTSRTSWSGPRPRCGPASCGAAGCPGCGTAGTPGTSPPRTATSGSGGSGSGPPPTTLISSNSEACVWGDDRVSVQGRLGQDERRDQRAAAAGAAAGPPGRRPQHHRGRQRGGQRSADRSNNLSIFCTAG